MEQQHNKDPQPIETTSADIAANPLLGVVLSSGYEKKDYGYKKVTENNTHWITLFGEGEFQMYAYYSEDTEMEKVYDTGVIDKASSVELQTLIRVLVENHA